MSANLTEKQIALGNKMKEFAERELKPIAHELDLESKFPREVLKKMGKEGFLNMGIPKEYGGQGLGMLDFVVVMEQLARVDAGTGVTLAVHQSLCSTPIATYGNKYHKEKYLPRMATGELLGAFGLTESEAGSDASGLETTAELEGDHYILNGGKIFISNAPEADIYLIFASTHPEMGTRGISAFLVEKGWEGFTYGEIYNKMGIRSSPTAELIFRNVKVPKENLVGQEGQGFRIAMETLDSGRIGVASQGLGIAVGAFDSAVEYAKEREQFGMPIAFNQGISFMISEMAAKLYASRSMIHDAAMLKDSGKSFVKEAAMAKFYATERAVEVCDTALQIYGGAGYIKGIDVERAYRDVRITPIYEGTNQIQRIIVSGAILGKPPKTTVAKGKKSEVTGERKKQVWSGNPKESVAALVEALKADGYDFTVGIPIDTPIPESERVVSVGRGIGKRENMKLAGELAKQVGAALGSSRPVAETLKYLPLNRYVGLTGQKFRGNLYIACGISGAGQHLKGIKDAATIVAINNNPNARIFKNVDYGIVGNIEEILPLLSAALDTGEAKKAAPPMKRMKKRTPKKLPPAYDVYLCIGCGYEYTPSLGDSEGDVKPGTSFDNIPEEWICPDCGEEKDTFIKIN